MRKLWLMILVIAMLFTVQAQSEKEWITRSNSISMELLKQSSELQPEGAAHLGIEGLDHKISDIALDSNQKALDLTRKQISYIEGLLKSEKDPQVVQDLEITLGQLKDSVITIELEQKHFYEYYNIPQLIFRSTQSLLNPQNAPDRFPAALVRLRKYTGLEPGFKPITEKAMLVSRESFKRKGLIGPNKAELKNHLANYDRFAAGIESLFQEFKISGAEPALAAMKQQFAEYKKFVESEMMTRASESIRLPAEVYANNLKNFGVRWTPEQLIERAQLSFLEISNEMKALAPLVAAQKGFQSNDYRQVIAELKKQQFKDGEILPHYSKRADDLNQLIDLHDIITLPGKPMMIELGSPAESAAQPAPHLRQPRMIGNTGEQPVFVLPVDVPAQPGSTGTSVKMDDFTHEAASWTLTVHEGRPGHELQFARMLETGVSTARMLFAFNSVNVEGWALYSEAVMKPQMPLDGQLISLQHRLLRAARAFLDPMLQLGLTTPEKAKDFLMQELVLSEPMARQEVDRYSFRAPGQATSYFYGYCHWMRLRQMTEFKLGDKFDESDFHDFVLSQGLLPPELLEQALESQFIPGKRNATPAGTSANQ